MILSVYGMLVDIPYTLNYNNVVKYYKRCLFMRRAFTLLILVICILSGCSKDTEIVITSPSITISTPPETIVEVHSTTAKPEEEIVTETVIEIKSKVEEPAQPFYIVTSEERELLARLLYLEASICSIECKEAVVSVIFNRLDSGRWTKDMNDDGRISLDDIIYYPEAFTPAYKIHDTTPDEECYIAVDNIILNGPTIPTQVRYFRTNHDFRWADYSHYCTMDNLYFGYFTDWENGAW